MNGILIGEVARRTGFPPATLRYYEDIGLLKKPARADSGYRSYSVRTVDELLFIRKALSGERGKWTRQGTAITCDGLCQFISDAVPTSGVTLSADKSLRKRKTV